MVYPWLTFASEEGEVVVDGWWVKENPTPGLRLQARRVGVGTCVGAVGLRWPTLAFVGVVQAKDGYVGVVGVVQLADVVTNIPRRVGMGAGRHVMSAGCHSNKKK